MLYRNRRLASYTSTILLYTINVIRISLRCQIWKETCWWYQRYIARLNICQFASVVFSSMQHTNQLHRHASLACASLFLRKYRSGFSYAVPSGRVWLWYRDAGFTALFKNAREENAGSGHGWLAKLLSWWKIYGVFTWSVVHLSDSSYLLTDYVTTCPISQKTIQLLAKSNKADSTLSLHTQLESFSYCVHSSYPSHCIYFFFDGPLKLCSPTILQIWRDYRKHIREIVRSPRQGRKLLPRVL